MPDLDLDNGGDPQDEAEVFDETHRENEPAVGSDDQPDDPDIAEDVYDVTSAIGDADDDQYEMDAADAGPDDLDPDDFEEDEDEDDDLDDDLEDEPEDDDLDDGDDLIDLAAAAPHDDEPGLTYVDDVDLVTQPRDDEVEKYESTRPLSDAQLRDLGYRNAASPDNQKETDTMDPEQGAKDKTKGAAWEKTNDELIQGTGASAEDVPDEADPGEDERLDEGLEETFPASDPVSAKHIT
ncbi:MAG: hypothetical protein JWO72_3325 [Caulobacteraceae bacterium]|nr:hypothetical protein [Caulobacteraceae bacterium]